MSQRWPCSPDPILNSGTQIVNQLLNVVTGAQILALQSIINIASNATGGVQV
jgi:hypothetical protein